MSNQCEHWKKRAAQRGISSSTLELVRQYGLAFFDGRHGYCELLGRRQVDKVLRDHPELKGKIERLQGVMLVSDTNTDECVTVKHVYTRVRRDCQPGRRRAQRRATARP
jgi:hypothetical protein